MNAKRAAFDQLVRRLNADLYRFAYWLSRDDAIAQDLVQESFLRAWRSLADLRDDKAAKAWLMTIVRREHARMFERKVPPIDDIADLVIEDQDTPSAFEMSEIQEMRDAIARIEDKYREPLLLQLVGGFSCEEIADQLGITASAVMTQLFRARAKLKALLRGDSQGKVHELH
ncbi:MAG TPA: sigma-70 family RNA polymerase sigma factor [Xanthomonadales bacterium]|nr:sigma-70 family RNA polymerase sigma factor [Xanthomonadales bacterium]